MLPVLVIVALVVGALGLVVARRRLSAPGRHAAARRPDALTGVPALLTAAPIAPPAEPEPQPVAGPAVAVAPAVEPEPAVEAAVEPEPVVAVESDADAQVVAEAEQVVADAEQTVVAERAAPEPSEPNVTAPVEPETEPESAAELPQDPPARPARTPGGSTRAAAARTRQATVSVDAGAAPKVRRCGHCRTPGHTRTTCPDLTDPKA